jgi:hypothetical protein
MPSAEVGRRAQEARFELLAMGAVVDPFARGSDPLACRNGWGVTDHSHDITMPARRSAGPLGPGIPVARDRLQPLGDGAK